MNIKEKNKQKTMKHVKTFENFLNEKAIFNPKDFNQVKPGDTAFVMGDNNPWKVLAVGTGADFKSKLQKYDESGAITDMQNSPGAHGMDKSDWEELELIAVEQRGETAVYTYGDDGAWVNK